jgi:DNA-binding response OmpR family regulator
MTTAGFDLSDASGPSSAGRRRAVEPLRIIVADDDRDTVQMLGAILQDEGHHVHGVYTGKAVLPAVRIFCPDVVIVDVNIPGLSGYAVAQAIRHAFIDVRMPLLIAISGFWTETPDRLVGEQMGFEHHLTKPADPKEVLALLEGAPRRRNPGQQ